MSIQKIKFINGNKKSFRVDFYLKFYIHKRDINKELKK